MRAIPCPLSEQELRQMVEVERLTDDEIAARLEGGTNKRVQSWRKRFGIDALPRWARHEVTPIEGRLRSLLVGSMLGDGRLVFQGTGTYYTETHSEAQRPYLEWKATLWGEGWVRELREVPDTRGYKQCRMWTVAHGSLNEWQELFYASRGKGWKRLVPRVVDLVDEFALAIWYLDDGTASCWWPSITFGAGDASLEVSRSIFEKFGLRPRWEVKQGKTGEFHFEREDTAHRFLDIIRPHVPACMSYKTEGFGFMGPHYEVRQKVTEASLREMAGRGMPIKRMAREFGVGASTVARWLTKLSIEHPRQVGRPRLLLG